MSYLVENLLDVMNKVGEKELISSFSGFSCDVNKDIQDFLQLKS